MKRGLVTALSMLLVLALPCIAMAGVQPSAPGVFPIVEEPVTLKVFAAVESWITDLYTNTATVKWQEHTNVEVDWVTTSPGELGTEALNLLLSAGVDMPDVIFWNFSNQQLMTYGGQGMFIPLNALIDEYGYFIKEQMIKDIPETLKVLTAPDGNIYAMPNFNGCFHCTLMKKAWINQYWLDSVGLAVPTSIDELYAALQAFKDNAGNGVIPADGIPLIGNGGWTGQIESFLMCPYILDTGSDAVSRFPRLMLNDNGDVINVAVTDEFKAGLLNMRKWFSEGLIDEQAFTLTQNEAMMLTGNPDGNLVGVFMGGGMNSAIDLSNDVKDEFVSLPPLKGPDGVARTPLFKAFPSPRGVITSNCENPEVAFRWMDGMLDGSLDAMMTFWRPEPNFRYALEGELGLDGKPATNAIGVTDKGEPYYWGAETNSWWGGLNIEYNTDAFRTAMAADTEGFNGEKVWYEASLLYQPYGVATLPPLFADEAAMKEWSEIEVLTNNYINESVAAFVTGSADIDSDWDNYINTLNDMGLARYLELVQAAYDAQYK